MTNKSHLPIRTQCAADYITKAKRNRLMRLAISSILMTMGGSLITPAAISRRVGCSARTVASVKIELRTLGLLGVINADAPIGHRAPEASYVNMETRLFDLQHWFRDLNAEGLVNVRIAEARAETQELLRIIRREGSMPRHFTPVSQRLEDLEKLYQLPEYDLMLLAA